MSRKQLPIPLHTQETGPGISIRPLLAVNATDIYQQQAHRDDHYLFLLIEKGSCFFMIDFEQLSLKAGEIIYVYPGQVHACLEADHLQATALSVVPPLIQPMYRSALEEVNGSQRPLLLDKASIGMLTQSIQLLEQLLKQPVDKPFRQQLLNSGTDICMGIFLAALKNSGQETGNSSRPEIIMRQFRTLLVNNYLSMRTPSAYAAALHISLSYLSEIVRQQSGFTVNHWIHQQLILEAKRQLYHTDHTIKEIAYELGFDDQAYFSRLFREKTGIAPQQFRVQCRK
ncbi:AraC family transcriptional regulator [Chitinophaga qingshengii]|uniref:AraC family transcriptional regulator n=1 Tax=Chitinophaga qingshengii TaxID=1569794 RepID=A0ABR7TYR9_9BACT|nr:helix-turn-helix domain-containing protein [Chitinophaga qingshengii]MBC9934691.1 AraC family transcriptional regulator [Chitinophaga qingshengii]